MAIDSFGGQSWLKGVFGKDAQKNNYASEQFIAKDFKDFKTLDDIAPYGILKDFKGPTETSTLYGWEDYPWSYQINKYNHRDDFPTERKIKIGIFGSSDVMGAGVEHTFAKRLQEKLPPNYGVYNFGSAGANMLVVHKKFQLVTHFMDLDIAIVSFPEIKLLSFRDQQFKVLGALTNIVPHSKEWVQLLCNFDEKQYDELNEEIKAGKEGIPLQLFLWKHVDNIARIARQKKIKLAMGGYARDVAFGLLKDYPDVSLPRWEWHDRAPMDKAHPGQNSHDDYANMIYNYLKV